MNKLLKFIEIPIDKSCGDVHNLVSLLLRRREKRCEGLVERSSLLLMLKNKLKKILDELV